MNAEPPSSPLSRLVAHRYFLPALCIALPVFVSIALDWYASVFLPTQAEIQQIILGPGFSAAPDRLQVEVPARMQYAFSALLLMIAAVAATAYALIRAEAPHRAPMALFAAVIGLVVLISDETVTRWLGSCDPDVDKRLSFVLGCANASAGEWMRLVAVDHVLTQLGLMQESLTPLWLGAWAAMIGVISTAALAATFFLLAKPNAGSAKALRKRKLQLQTTLGLSAVVLTLSVASNRAFYLWPASMLSETDAKAYADLISMAAGYWGLMYTLVLIAASAPALMALRRDVFALAERKAPAPEKIAEWIDAEKLRFAPREGFGAALAAAAPILTSPVLDMLTTGVI